MPNPTFQLPLVRRLIVLSLNLISKPELGITSKNGCRRLTKVTVRLGCTRTATELIIWSIVFVGYVLVSIVF